MFDYLRRSGLAGLFLPLSGGIDSCASAIVVFSMCRILVQAIQEGNEAVAKEVQRIAGPLEKAGWLPKTPQELCYNILHTCYMVSTFLGFLFPIC